MVNSCETKNRAYIGVCVVNKHCQCRQNFTNHVHRRRWILVAAKVHHDPRHVPEERQRNVWVDEGNERLDNAKTDDVIATLRAITCTQQCQHLLSPLLVANWRPTDMSFVITSINTVIIITIINFIIINTVTVTLNIQLNTVIIQQRKTTTKSLEGPQNLYLQSWKKFCIQKKLLFSTSLCARGWPYYLRTVPQNTKWKCLAKCTLWVGQQHSTSITVMILRCIITCDEKDKTALSWVSTRLEGMYSYSAGQPYPF